MAKIIEAKAVISAQDKTGNVFDSIAKKFKGVAKDAKALSEIKPPKLSGDFFEKELGRLKLTQREMRGVQKEFQALHKSMMDVGPQHPARYMKQIDDWRGRTIQHWREVKTATEAAGKAHDKYAAREKQLHRLRHGVNHTIAHVAGIASGSYAVGAGVHAVAEAAGERGRAVSRYDMMGLSADELREGNDIAGAISQRFPSISRTEVLDYLRSNASRLGSWERSKEVAEPYARALIANKLNGGDEHEMEQIVRALEGMGKANTSGQITAGLTAFARAKAANPDYTGEQFRTDMAAASSAKYGLSKDYLENVFPILASHTTGFGNKLSTGLSAMVGGRMTKQAKGALEADGLIKNGSLVDKEGWIANNFEWTQKHIRPLLEKQGINFSEDMSEGDKGKVVAWLAKHFSARNAADLVATNLLDAPLVEKGRHRNTKSLEDMDALQKRDPMLAWQGVKNQATDAGVAMMGLESVTKGLNEFGGALARFTNFLNDPKHALPQDSPIMSRINARAAENASDFLWRDELAGRLTEADQKLSPGYGLGARDTATWRLKKFDLEQGKNALDRMSSQPPIFTDDEVERMRELDREHMRGEALSHMDGRRGSSVPMPQPRPAEANAGSMPPVQPLDNAPQRVDVQGTVEGSVAQTVTIKIEPSKWWEALEQKVDGIAKLVGSLGSNGPGSNGKSSPDTAAPSTGASMPQP